MQDKEATQSKGLKEYFKTSADLKECLKSARVLVEKRHDEEGEAFLNEFENRFRQFGAKTMLSEKQHRLLMRLSQACVEDWFGDDSPKYEELLSAASDMASDDWMKEFVNQQQERYNKYGLKAGLSEKQKNMLEKIASGEAEEREVETEW